MADQTKSKPSEDYLVKFNAFLESKLHQVNDQKALPRSFPVTSQSHSLNLANSNSSLLLPTKDITNQINKRLSKLQHIPNQDRKINSILMNFRNVSTYVDIKEFIGQLRPATGAGLTFGNKQIQMDEVSEGDSVIEDNLMDAPKQIGEQKQSKQQDEEQEEQKDQIKQMSMKLKQKIRDIMQGNFSNIKLMQNRNIVNKLKMKNKTGYQLLLNNYCPTDPFQLKLYNSAINDHQQYQREKQYKITQDKLKNKENQKLKDNNNLHHKHKQKSKHLKNVKSATLPSEESEQIRISVELYKKQLSRISGEMHTYLENMHLNKWNQKEKERQQKKKVVVEQQEKERGDKPLMDIKYKYHAPKGVFEFVDKSPKLKIMKGKYKSRIKLNRSIDNFSTQPPSPLPKFQNPKNNRSSIKLPNPHLPSPRRNSLLKTCPISSSTKPLFPAPQQSLKSLHNLKQIKHRYNFKKPQIKNTILKRIVDFIDDLENSQFAFRKTNVNLLNSINQMEARNMMDYEKILEEGVDLEELRNIANRYKKMAL